MVLRTHVLYAVGPDDDNLFSVESLAPIKVLFTQK